MERIDILKSMINYIINNGEVKNTETLTTFDGENPRVTYEMKMGDYSIEADQSKRDDDFYYVSVYKSSEKYTIFADFSNYIKETASISIIDVDRNSAMAVITPEYFMKDKYTGLMFKKLSCKSVDEITLIDSVSRELTLLLDALESYFAKILGDPLLLQDLGFKNRKKYKF